MQLRYVYMMKLTKYVSIFMLIFLYGLANAQVPVRVAVPTYDPFSTAHQYSQNDIGTKIIKIVAFDEGWTLQFVSCEPSLCMSLLESGEVDVISASLETSERREKYKFSKISFLTDWPNLISKSKVATHIKTLDDISGMKFSLVRGSDSAVSFVETLEKYSLSVKYHYVKNIEELVGSLKTKQVDFAVTSNIIAPYFQKKQGRYHTLDFMVDPYKLKFAVKKGRNDFIIDQLDSAQMRYQKMKNSDYMKLTKKHLSSHIFSREGGWRNLVLLGLIITICILTLSCFFFFLLWKKRGLNVNKMEAMVIGASKVKTDFLANMSHEIRTPLNAIMGMTEVLMDSPLSLKQKRHLEMINGGSENLLIIINDILDLSRIESGEIQVNRYQGDIRKLLCDVVNMVSLRFAGRDLGFTLDIKQDVPREIITDHVRLRHILANLISNAGKFTDQGDVYIRVSPEGKESIFIEVIDTGKGMNQESLDQIFVEFWQEDFSSRKKYGGTGLGLSITKQLVQLLDGTIDVKSKEGVGSTFSVSLPVGELSSFEQELPGSSNFRGQSIATVSSKKMEREFIRDFYASKGGEPHIYSELSTDFFSELNTFDIIFIEHSLLSYGEEFNMHCIDRLRNVANKVIIIYPIGVEPVLMRDFAIHNFLRHVIRPLSKNNICSESFDAVTGTSKDNKKILIIDDEPDFRLMLEDSIDVYFDLQVTSVGSGKEGLSALRKIDFDLVILDIQMREMSGVEFFNRMKQLDINIPVLFLSGHYLDENILANVDGTYLYVDKVDGIAEVMTSIEKLLEFDCEDKEIPREVAKTVLVIDDSPVNVTLIEAMLEKFNYKLITGENGKEAFELYLEHSPDIILMDLQMPEVDGYQATENIRKHELENEVDFPVPILAISAYALENEIAKAFQAGCTEYLCKPIKKKQLYPLIDELLKK